MAAARAPSGELLDLKIADLKGGTAVTSTAEPALAAPPAVAKP